MSGSGISWAICKSAPRSRQITTPAPHHSVFLQAGCPSCRPTNSIKALKVEYTVLYIAANDKTLWWQTCLKTDEQDSRWNVQESSDAASSQRVTLLPTPSLLKFHRQLRHTRAALSANTTSNVLPRHSLSQAFTVQQYQYLQCLLTKKTQKVNHTVLLKSKLEENHEVTCNI